MQIERIRIYQSTKYMPNKLPWCTGTPYISYLNVWIHTKPLKASQLRFGGGRRGNSNSLFLIEKKSCLSMHACFLSTNNFTVVHGEVPKILSFRMAFSRKIYSIYGYCLTSWRTQRQGEYKVTGESHKKFH